mmetsp:Transcript_34817/g.92978  ORF Transcript_34817/g.92978 Transcript_34817/m.92978 type:complete len:92 (-) Transcript_34817:344-619(-)
MVTQPSFYMKLGSWFITCGTVDSDDVDPSVTVCDSVMDERKFSRPSSRVSFSPRKSNSPRRLKLKKTVSMGVAEEIDSGASVPLYSPAQAT